MDRDQWLELTTGGVEWNSFEFRSAKGMVVGDVGVVASMVTRQGTVSGDDTSGEFATVDTWLRREGRWQIINRVVLPFEPDQVKWWRGPPPGPLGRLLERCAGQTRSRRGARDRR